MTACSVVQKRTMANRKNPKINRYRERGGKTLNSRLAQTELLNAKKPAGGHRRRDRLQSDSTLN